MTWVAKSADDSWSISLPANPESAGFARQYVAERVADLSPELRHDLLVLVSELVTNAVLHGRPEITLRLSLDTSTIGVAVEDADTTIPTLPAEAAPTVGHGRGLRIVNTLASSWGVRPRTAAPGKIVWFELHA